MLRAPVDDEVRRQADDHHARLTKPPGSLGRLEALGAQLAAIAGRCPPPVPAPVAIAVFAGDHGVHAQGVSSWPQEVTAQMAANFLAGGAAINVLARHLGAAVAVVDVGIASSVAVPGTIRRSLEGGGLSRDPVWLDRRIRAGTSDLSIGPAMSTAEAQAALDIGVDVATQLAHAGARLLVTGDMGIANTTPAAALIAAYTGTDALAVTGRGAGIDGPTFGRKAKLVAQAAARVASLPHGPLGILAEVGGFEHAALAGYIIGAAGAGVPVVADGVIALSAVLAAEALSPGVKNWVIAGHRSSEPGATAALEHLGMQPILDLGLRLGEGSGAALAVPIVQAAALVMAEMATFDDAGVDRSPPEL
ncbi:MAG: nicotinate-nucleotide--dimethylbenzimidazole phosphoribosyltransferase [Acidimicrobiales bacterium]